MVKASIVGSVTLVVTILLSGCSEFPDIENCSICDRTLGVPIEYIEPSEYSNLYKYEKIAVANFAGPAGTAVSQQVKVELESARLLEHPMFDVSTPAGFTSRMSVSSMMREAKRQGYDAVYMGNTDINREWSKHERKEVCVKREGTFNTGDCKKKEYHTCRYVKGTLLGTLQVVDVATGSIVYDKSKSSLNSKKHCKHYSSSEPDPSELALQQADELVEAFRQDIIPRTKKKRIPFESADNAVAEVNKADFERARDLIIDRDFSRGCGLYEELYEDPANQQSYALAFNLGACAEYQADYETAMQMYKLAANVPGIKSSKTDKARKALERVESSKDVMKRVRDR